MNSNQALASRIRASLPDIEAICERAIQLSQKALQTGDDGFWDGVALNLHSFYTGTEQVFEDIARSIEADVPAGSEWHRDLLAQMSSEISGIRPAVITRHTRACLDAYRGFRHVVRNVYTFNLRPARLQDLVGDLRDCLDNLRRDLLEFIGFLDQTIM